MRTAWLGLLVLLLLVPPAWAGTAEAPEVEDASGDGSPQDPAPNQEFLDVLKAWVDVPSPTQLAFHVEVAGSPPVPGIGVGAPQPAPIFTTDCLFGGASVYYQLHYQTLNPAGKSLVAEDAEGNTLTSLYLQAQLVCDSTASGGDLGWDFNLFRTWDSATGSTIAGEVVDGSVEGSTITWVLERSNPLVKLPAGSAAGYTVGDLYAASGLYYSVVAGSNDPAVDRAPDADFGTAFEFGGEESAVPATIFTDLEDAVVEHAWTEAKSASYQFNWTSPWDQVVVAYTVAATNGTARVVVTDPTGTAVLDELFSAGEKGSLQHLEGSKGDWTLNVTYDGFVGELGLAIDLYEPPAAAPTGPSPVATAGTEAPSEETTLATSDGKDSPGLGVVALGAGLLAVALRRRR